MRTFNQYLAETSTPDEDSWDFGLQAGWDWETGKLKGSEDQVKRGKWREFQRQKPGATQKDWAEFVDGWSGGRRNADDAWRENSR